MASSRRRRRLIGIGLRHGAAMFLITCSVMLLGRGMFAFDWAIGALVLPLGLYWYITLVVRQRKESQQLWTKTAERD